MFLFKTERGPVMYVNSAPQTVSPLYSVVPGPWIQPTADQKYVFFKSYIVADMHYIVKPKMVLSVLNMGRLCFSCHHDLNNTV